MVKPSKKKPEPIVHHIFGLFASFICAYVLDVKKHSSLYTNICNAQARSVERLNGTDFIFRLKYLPWMLLTFPEWVFCEQYWENFGDLPNFYQK